MLHPRHTWAVPSHETLEKKTLSLELFHEIGIMCKKSTRINSAKEETQLWPQQPLCSAPS